MVWVSLSPARLQPWPMPGQVVALAALMESSPGSCMHQVTMAAAMQGGYTRYVLEKPHAFLICKA